MLVVHSEGAPGLCHAGYHAYQVNHNLWSICASNTTEAPSAYKGFDAMQQGTTIQELPMAQVISVVYLNWIFMRPQAGWAIF